MLKPEIEMILFLYCQIHVKFMLYKKAVVHEVFGIHCCMAEEQEAVSGRGRAREVQLSFLWEVDPSMSEWELCTSPRDGFAWSVTDTASNMISSRGQSRQEEDQHSASMAVRWCICALPSHLLRAQMHLAKKVQTSLQLDLMQSKSSTLPPPRAFVLHFQCNYMLNICLSMCWIPSICMTCFNAGLAKPNGMTAMPSNNTPRDAGRACPAPGGAGEGRTEENQMPPVSCHTWTCGSKRRDCHLLCWLWMKNQQGNAMLCVLPGPRQTHSLCHGGVWQQV